MLLYCLAKLILNHDELLWWNDPAANIQQFLYQDAKVLFEVSFYFIYFLDVYLSYIFLHCS